MKLKEFLNSKNSPQIISNPICDESEGQFIEVKEKETPKKTKKEEE